MIRESNLMNIIKQLIIIISISISFILLSCSHYEGNPEIILKAYNFKPEKDKAVIYVLRDFSVEKPTHIQFLMVEKFDPDRRDKLVDALNALDGGHTEGAGIPYNYYNFLKNSFARLEMVPSIYEMYAYFLFAGQTEIVESRYTEEFEAGKVYFYKMDPKNDGAFNSTIYHLKEIAQDEADKIIQGKHLNLIDFDESY